MKRAKSRTGRLAAILSFCLICGSTVHAENKSERLEWFMDQALGMFVHWSVDSQLGSVISHSMVSVSSLTTTSCGGRVR